MGLEPQIYTANVMHRRLFPKRNTFRYRVYYLTLPLAKLPFLKCSRYVPINRSGLVSFHERDHGARDGGSLKEWIESILAENKLCNVVKDVILVTMPRVLGYAFNPVSFWLCLDESEGIRAVLCEVNNTFGETHSYLCTHSDHRVIQPSDVLSAKKFFYVSPFIERSGYYQFRFSLRKKGLTISIDYYDKHGKRQLVTSLAGSLQPLNKRSLRRVFWTHPLLTFKVIALIHWQGLKLLSKRICYIQKPKQLKSRMSV